MCVNIFYKIISYKKYYSDKKVKLMFFMCVFCGVFCGYMRGVIGGGNMVVLSHIPTLNLTPYFTPILHPNLYPLRGVPTYTPCQK